MRRPLLTIALLMFATTNVSSAAGFHVRVMRYLGIHEGAGFHAGAPRQSPRWDSSQWEPATTAPNQSGTPEIVPAVPPQFVPIDPPETTLPVPMLPEPMPTPDLESTPEPMLLPTPDKSTMRRPWTAPQYRYPFSAQRQPHYFPRNR